MVTKINRIRIHGDIVVKRRGDLKRENQYAKYRKPLMEDFSKICGYCGIHMIISRRGFEIDHFVPISVDSDRETDYSNLVFSCFTCNRKKSKKWPTENKDLCHDGVRGFVDPTLEDYDNHLGRNPTGVIEYYSTIGEYMYSTFKFELRPTDIVWKCMELHKRKNLLYELEEKRSLSFEEMKLFISIQRELDNLLSHMLGIGE